MVTTRELTGSKTQIVEQIQQLSGRILSAILIVDEPIAAQQVPLSDVELAKLLAEMEADTVAVPHADDSREAIYTRMPGE